MTTTVPKFEELIAGTEFSAIHLEMRDMYTPKGAVYVDWKAGIPIEYDRHGGWVELVGAAVARGVDWRRARVVSEPVTDFIQYEYETATIVNVPAGENVRWLPRRLASDLLLPGNDFWVFDNRLVRFTHFAGDGSYGPHELSDDPALVKNCVDAFEAVWARAIDHKDYTPVV
ncbi:hypothetical protein Ssi03_37560 [Sphaerisporangium siamense]|uniref:DUF6879 domain-containing protein n=1 Tax=Sphaerisporangium siamense TaxID=795645 RepID=A0A7W7D7W5_9ACTN|nr:DUF6879 family protein [Sphaerisporangium siamense]MBB4701641.1 hypothetical protein [Sphaerisporangium siamense]GII85766.1 hypothetical protein Ssi03_37560 [Sphaerisporangium siamense]